jgi:hypothetical protein
VAAVVIVTTAVILLLKRQEDHRAPPANELTSLSQGGSGTSDTVSTRAGLPAGAVADQAVSLPELRIPERPTLEQEFNEDGGSTPVVKVYVEQVLARVNGQDIRLNHLMSVDTSERGKAHKMTPDDYDFLLNRAVQRTAVLQEAAKQGISLTDAHRLQLDEVRDAVMRREGGDPNAVHMNIKGSMSDRIAFEVEEATANLLLDELLRREGYGSPFVTPEEVDRYYQEHQQEFGPLPDDPGERERAWPPIDRAIRERLAIDVLKRYGDAAQLYVENLLTQGNVVLIQPQP